MKKLLFYLFVITLYSCGGDTSGECGGKTVIYSEEKENLKEEDNGLYYKGTPFTGTLYFDIGSNEQKQCWKDGLKNGITETYFGKIDGKLYQRVNWKDGKEHRIGEEYDRDGKKTMEVRYENGTLMLGN